MDTRSTTPDPKPKRRTRLWIVVGCSLAAVAAIFVANRSNSPEPAPRFFISSASPKAAQPSANVESNLAPSEISAPLTEWAQQYLAASKTEKASLLNQGLILARERRAALSDLIRNDPQAALRASLARKLRDQLPAPILAELEQTIAARAPIDLIHRCFFTECTDHDHSADIYRATVIDNQEYRVHVYGSRVRDASLPETSINGIAIDGHLAVSESRVRVVEPGESLPEGTPPLTPESIAVEANGSIHILSSASELTAFEATIVASESNSVELADSGSGSSGVTGRPTQAWTHDDKKLLVILVDFSDLMGRPVNQSDSAPITEDYVSNVINGSSGVRDFIKENSFYKSDIILTPTSGGDSPDITNVLRMPNTAASYAASGDNALLHTHARALATTDGYTLANYDRICVVFSNLSGFPSSLITYGGLGSVIGDKVWVNGSFNVRVVAHELGHNYGLLHSNLWQVSDGNPVSPSGSSIEYGDVFDVMSNVGTFTNHFSQWNKSILRWIPDSSVTLAATSGTYRIHRFDSSTADLAQPRALKIVRDGVRDYWIGYRRATSSTYANNGAYVLWGYNSNQQGNLIDLSTPDSNVNDAPLALNSSFNDSAAGIIIQPTAQGGTGAEEWMDIAVTFQPRLQWSSASYLVNEQGGNAVLSVTRTNNSSGAISVSYATSSGTAISGTDFTGASGTLNWANGESTTKTISIPLTADALVEGTETFTVTLSSVAGGVIVPAADATVTIADPGSRDPTLAADWINSTVNRALVLPDGKIVIAGWFTQVDSYNYVRVAQLLANGSINPNFNPGTGANNTVWALARQADGKILIGGDFTSVNGVTRGRIARLNTDGSLDTSFATGAGAGGTLPTVYSILPLPDGKILVGGDFTTYNGVNAEYLVRLDANGNRDTGFTGPNFDGTTGRVTSLALLADGKCLVGGGFYFTEATAKSGLCRILTTGARDTTFTGITNGAHLAGNTSFLRTIEQVAVQPDGKILIVGQFTAYNNVARGGFARLDSTGALDLTFAPQPNNTCYSLLLLPDQSILIGGLFTSVSSTSASRIARISSSGAVDTSFAAAGGHAGDVMDLVLQPNGNVVLAGDYASFQGALPESPVWRLVPGMSGTPGVVQFQSETSVTASEGTITSLNVTRSGGSLGDLTVGYSTVDDTALSTSDYTSNSGTLTWASGNTDTKTITVPITADAIIDTPETLNVNLGAPLIGGAILGERQQATINIETGFGTWLSTHFSAAELINPAIVGDDADPDGDGLSNLTEFALCLDPQTSDRNSAWTMSVQNIGAPPGTNYLALSFRRRVPTLDLSYSVQTGDQLTSWSGVGVIVGSPVANGDGTETVIFRDTIPVTSATKRFMRVSVTRTP